jgi:hypothetical protein
MGASRNGGYLGGYEQFSRSPSWSMYMEIRDLLRTNPIGVLKRWSWLLMIVNILWSKSTKLAHDSP